MKIFRLIFNRLTLIWPIIIAGAGICYVKYRFLRDKKRMFDLRLKMERSWQILPYMDKSVRKKQEKRLRQIEKLMLKQEAQIFETEQRLLKTQENYQRFLKDAFSWPKKTNLNL